MANITLSSSVSSIDDSAQSPIAQLIVRFMLMYNNVSSINIETDRIIFYSFGIFKKGEILFEDNGLTYSFGTIRYTGQIKSFDPTMADVPLYKYMESMKTELKLTLFISRLQPGQTGKFYFDF